MAKMRYLFFAMLASCIYCLMAIQAHAVTMYVGDVDGFGFGGASGYNGAYGGPADRDANGILESRDVLPDLNGNGDVRSNGGDDFDNRSAAEANDTRGAAWTDVSLSRSFDDRPGLADDVSFTFHFSVPSPGDADYEQAHFVSFIYGDYDVSPMYALIEGVEVSLLGNKAGGGLNGHIWRAYSEVSWDDMLDGQILIEIVAPQEPYVTFDYALLDTEYVGVAFPAVSASPSNIEFGNVRLSNSSSPFVVTISSVGDEALQLQGLSIAGADPAAFSIQQDCPSELAPTEHCDVDVVYCPTEEGPQQARLSIESNDPDTPVLDVILRGTGTTFDPEPVITVSPDALNFGSLRVGHSSDLRPISIENQGTGNLILGELSITGPDAGDFRFELQSYNCSNANLTPSDSCGFNLIFHPTSIGAKSASLVIPSNDPDTPAYYMGLAGEGYDVTAPEADAGPDRTISDGEQETITLQGTASDGDNDPLEYRWREGLLELSPWQDVGQNGEAPLFLGDVVALSLETHLLTLEVSDGLFVSSDDMALTVADSCAALGGDTDEDGVCDDNDNCPTVPNFDQQNGDGDTFGDMCDGCPYDPDNDIDGDGICADADNCPWVANPQQTDSNNDGTGDDCTSPSDCICDLNMDGICGEDDLILFGSSHGWGDWDCNESDVHCRCDLVEDDRGTCNSADGAVFLAAYAMEDCRYPVFIRKIRNASVEPGQKIVIAGSGFGSGVVGEGTPVGMKSVVHIGKKTIASDSGRMKLWTDAKIKVKIPKKKYTKNGCAWFKGEDTRTEKVWISVGNLDSNKKHVEFVKPADCP